MNRQQRAAIAQETLQIQEGGHYTSPSGYPVDIGDDLSCAVNHSRLYRPDDIPDPDTPPYSDYASPCNLIVTGRTTLEAAYARASEEPLALNFASARKPGGGFLSGSQAQEESLARASGLYPCIAQFTEMYNHNIRSGTALYSDYMIYSPGVPVIRGADDILLEEPYLLSVITSPAVNANAIAQNEPDQRDRIVPVMLNRLKKVLWIAASHGHKTLIPGAWGCGVFGNHPETIARLFAETLTEGGTYARSFSNIELAVYDPKPDKPVLKAFQKVF